jgi:hypothetical protein
MAGAARQPFSIFAAGLSLAISTGVKPETGVARNSCRQR